MTHRVNYFSAYYAAFNENVSRHLTNKSCRMTRRLSQLETDGDGKIQMTDVKRMYLMLSDAMKGVNCGFDWTPEDYVKEIARRYDIDNNGFLCLEEAKEWIFCLAPFFDELDTNPTKFDQGRFQRAVSPTLSMCDGATSPDREPPGDPEKTGSEESGLIPPESFPFPPLPEAMTQRDPEYIKPISSPTRREESGLISPGLFNFPTLPEAKTQQYTE